MKADVLIVDDDPTLRKVLSDRFRFWGHTVDAAENGDQAIALAQGRRYDLILLDLMLPDVSGLEVLKTLKEGGCTADVVVLTAHGSVSSAVDALKLGAVDFLQKPADFALLQAVVERSLERQRLERVNRALNDRVDTAGGVAMGNSPVMQSLLETAGRAAQSRSTVLLTGESGTGKQVMAEYIHRQSPRRDGPLVYVNCVALPDDLVESILFGHEKGAFTGALSRKEGRLEQAGGGTAFLDEIGDMPLRLQSKLLHFLESGQFERVGGSRTISIDTRIIAASNRDLPAAVKEGRFREDLYFRLNVIVLPLPPLRERRQDIPVLARVFVDRFARDLQRKPPALSPKTIEILQSYPWPGNVRQLKNAMERMVVLSPGDTLGLELLPPEILAGGDLTEAEDFELPLRDAMRNFEKRYIQAVLARAGNNQTRAAEVLSLQRTYLNRRLKELGLRAADPADEAEE